MRRFGWILCVLWGLSLSEVRATHIAGGELRYQYNANTSQLTLEAILYFDNLLGSPGAVDQEVILGIYEQATDQRVLTFTLPLIQSDSLLLLNAEQCTEVRQETRILLYRSVSIVPAFSLANPAGYYVTWARCCRNSSVSNLVNPGQTGMTFYAQMPALSFGSNRSPVLRVPMSNYACLGRPYTLQIRATDPDGDRLIYRLAEPYGTPFNSGVIAAPVPKPFDPVVWRAGYGATNPFPSATPVQMDSLTGTISFTPLLSGLYVFSVEVLEKRNGRTIGMVKREYQLPIADCVEPFVPSSVIQLPGRPTLSGWNRSIEDTLYANENRCMRLGITGVTRSTPMRIRVVNTNITPAPVASPALIIPPSPLDTAWFTVCGPSCNLPANRVYFLVLETQDNNCPTPNTYRLQINYTLIKPPKAQLWLDSDLDGNQGQLRLGESLAVKLRGRSDQTGALSIRPLPSSDFSEGRGMRLSPLTSSPGQQEALFTWSPDCQNTPNPSTDQVYRLGFELRQNQDCLGLITDSLWLNVRLLPPQRSDEPFLPSNILTLNGDGKNEVWRLNNLPVDLCNDRFQYLEVYNRWGQRLFVTQQRDFTWVPPADLPVGTYLVLIRYAETSYKSWLEVMR